MKLATAAWGFQHMSLPDYFRAAASLGVRYVEAACGDEDHYYQNGPSLFRDAAWDVMFEEAEAAGVTVVTFVWNGAFVDARQAVVDYSIAKAKLLMDLLANTTVEVLRIWEGQIRLEQVDSHTYSRAARILTDLGGYAQDRGLVLAVENYGGLSGSPERMLQLLEDVAVPNVGLLYDACNYFRAGVDPLSAYRATKDRVVYVHLKDALEREERAPGDLFPESWWPPSVAVGEGDIDWVPILKELETFDGYVSIEYEPFDDVVRGTQASLQYVRRALDFSI